jgi:multiple sugar transport system permease protein
VFTVVPVVLSIVMSFYNWPTFGDKTFNGVDNYIKLFTSSPDFWPAMRNTAVFTIVYVPLSIVCS